MIKITNPDKILYAEGKITKEQLVDYYNRIAKWILPYIIERPLTLVRCPHGYKECFFQKHIENNMPENLYQKVIKSSSDKKPIIYIKDKNGLLTLAQLAVLEIHPWGSTVSDPDYPDYIIFDLDPAPDVEWKSVVHAAFHVRNELMNYKLKSFVKTTGGKGLHVVVPIKPEFHWDDVKNFAHVFVDYLVLKSPNEYISKMTKSKRKGKIFIDYLRNVRGATAVAPYSTRAREHAPIATPISWDELSTHKKDTEFTLKTLPSRLEKLRKDPWKDFFKIKQSLRIIRSR